ncbi:MAG: CHAT domain-containing protein [Bacteroidales bacterium]|nr:CHAT domain-containing protein [Bacteroidales bacterium]
MGNQMYLLMKYPPYLMRYSRQMRYCIIILCCLVSSQFVYSKSTNAFLNHADSLVYEGKFEEVVKYLLPLESEFDNETEINKYHYYGLISGWYLRQNDYYAAIPFLEKQVRSNQARIDDFLFLANIFSSDKKFIDRSKAEYYARKALLLDDEANRFSYSKDYTDQNISRLHYILGGLAARCGNKVISEEHLNWIKNNTGSIDPDLINHLKTLIDSIHNTNSIIACDTIRLDSHRLIKQSLANNSVLQSSSKTFFNHDNEVYEEDLDYIVSISNMAHYLRNVFYLEDKYGLDDINKSVALLNKACDISNTNGFYKTPSLELCELYMRLGRSEFFLKQYDSAITWFLLSYASSRKISDGIFYNIQALGEISDIYLAKGEKHNAILYGDEMLENIVDLALQGGINTEILLYLSRYANVLSNTGYDSVAENYYKIVIDSAPIQSKAYNLACNNYATHLFLRNKREEACYYYLLIKDAYPTPQTISNLAIAYLVSNRILDAERVFNEYYDMNLSLLENVLNGFTEKIWEGYWKKSGYEFYICSNYLASNIRTNESLIQGYNACVISKSLPLKYKNALNWILLSSVDPEVKADYDKYTMCKRELTSSMYTLAEKGQIISNLTELEQSIIQRVNFKDKLRFLINDYNSVVNSLKLDEVAIEFCQCLDLLNANSTYGAYIISPEYECPVFIVIGDEIELSNTIFNAQKDELSINQLYKQPDMGELIWGPIMPYLKNKRTVYFSPVGELSVLNHQLLQFKDSTLGDLFDMRRVYSTTSISENIHNDGLEYSDIALFGDINYDVTYEDMAIKSKHYNSSYSPQLNEDVRDGWSHLQYSRQEVDSIQSVIKKHDIYSTLYLGVNATEEAFKALDYNTLSIIHVATHGFTYFSNGEEEKRNKITSVSPHTSESIFMSWAGLLFAGANSKFIEQTPIQNFDDGILTANEISNLHLDGSNLIVLSACNTGLGINDTFGLTTGLQKAFKMAGAKSILMSLWQVPDESTALLMTKFYEALFNGHNRHEALKMAMKNVREIYPDPYYWGAFVILD